MTTKSQRHEATRRSWPPTSGAKIGGSRLTITRRERTRAASLSRKWSATMALARAMPVAAAMPCRKRMAMRKPTDGATTQRSDATTKSATPASKGFIRPILSLRGPTASCPTAEPNSSAVTVSCTAPVPACRSPATAGRPGWKRSLASALSMHTPPRTVMKTKTSRRPRGTRLGGSVHAPQRITAARRAGRRASAATRGGRDTSRPRTRRPPRPRAPPRLSRAGSRRAPRAG